MLLLRLLVRLLKNHQQPEIYEGFKSESKTQVAPLSADSLRKFEVYKLDEVSAPRRLLFLPDVVSPYQGSVYL